MSVEERSIKSVFIFAGIDSWSVSRNCCLIVLIYLVSTMGKSNKKANTEVALSVPTAPSKKGKKGKREPDAEFVAQPSLKKLKSSNKVPPEKKPETSSSEGSDSESEEEDVVYADFEFFDPKQNDFHGVKNLLKTYCDGIDWDLSGFVDMILAQTTVGTVIKTDEDSLFGVITAINLARYKDQRCIMELWKFLLNKSCQEANTIKLKAFLENHPHDVGLLVSERVVNLPFELVPPLYDALFDEVSWATEDEPTQALRDSFQFKHYLLISKVYQTVQDIQGECKETKIKIKRRKKGGSQNGDSEEQSNGQLIYIKPEDEIFHQLSSWSFTFPLHAEYQATHEFENLKTVQLIMAVKAEEIQTFRAQLKALLDESVG